MEMHRGHSHSNAGALHHGVRPRNAHATLPYPSVPGTDLTIPSLQQYPPEGKYGLPAAGSTFFADEVNETAMQMATFVGQFFETFMVKFPVVRAELMNRVESVCGKYGKPQECAKKRIEDEIKFVVWTSTLSGVGSGKDQATEQTVHKYLDLEGNVDIFMHNSTVVLGKNINPGHTTVALTTREYDLLTLFLRYRGFPLHTKSIYKNLWPAGAGFMGKLNQMAHEDNDLVTAVKPFISRMSKKMESIVPDFNIPPKNMEGYRCIGRYSFCVIILKCYEFKFTIPDISLPE